MTNGLGVALRVLSVLASALFAIVLLRGVVAPEHRIWLFIGVPLALLIAGALVAGLAGRPLLLAARVSRLRPGAVVIAARTTIETRADARLSGAVERRWDELGGSPVALAVLPDRVEVWAVGEDRPRWAVLRRPEQPPAAVLGTLPVGGAVGVVPTPALLITDGRSRVTVVPVYSVRGSSPQRAAVDVQRALAQIGAPA